MSSLEDIALLNIGKDFFVQGYREYVRLGHVPHNTLFGASTVFILMCTKGKINLEVKGHSSVVDETDLLFCDASIALDNCRASSDFRGKVLVLSGQSLREMLYGSKYNWDIFFHIAQKSVLKIKREMFDLINQYYDLIDLKTRQREKYRKEIIQTLVQTVLYEIFAFVGDTFSSIGDNMMRQGDVLFKKFMELLSRSAGKERRVSHFSRKLFVTPKYLSTVCKNVSGVTARELINNHTTEIIRYQLKHSDKSVKEISEQLDFPNLSFFAKYVRIHLGMSPTDFRK